MSSQPTTMIEPTNVTKVTVAGSAGSTGSRSRCVTLMSLRNRAKIV